MGSGKRREYEQARCANAKRERTVGSPTFNVQRPIFKYSSIDYAVQNQSEGHRFWKKAGERSQAKRQTVTEMTIYALGELDSVNGMIKIRTDSVTMVFRYQRFLPDLAYAGGHSS